MTIADDLGRASKTNAPRLTRPRLPGLGLGALCAIIGVFCILPFVLVLAISFGRKVEGAAWVWDFTFDNYQRFFVGILWPDEVTFLYLQQLGFSFYFAVIAALIASGSCPSQENTSQPLAAKRAS